LARSCDLVAARRRAVPRAGAPPVWRPMVFARTGRRRSAEPFTPTGTGAPKDVDGSPVRMMVEIRLHSEFLAAAGRLSGSIRSRRDVPAPRPVPRNPLGRRHVLSGNADGTISSRSLGDGGTNCSMWFHWLETRVTLLLTMSSSGLHARPWPLGSSIAAAPAQDRVREKGRCAMGAERIYPSRKLGLDRTDARGYGGNPGAAGSRGKKTRDGAAHCRGPRGSCSEASCVASSDDSFAGAGSMRALILDSCSASRALVPAIRYVRRRKTGGLRASARPFDHAASLSVFVILRPESRKPCDSPPSICPSVREADAAALDYCLRSQGDQIIEKGVRAVLPIQMTGTKLSPALPMPFFQRPWQPNLLASFRGAAP